jgi:flagellar protein FliO/FliZ
MDSLILGLRVLVALGAVLGLLWVLQRRLGKGNGRRRAPRDLTVVSRQGIGQKASVVVVDALGQRFLLGVTEHAVNVLHTGEIPAEAEEAAPARVEPAAENFADVLTAAQMPRRSSLHRNNAPAPMHGSILAGSTWRQAAAALRGGRNN